MFRVQPGGSQQTSMCNNFGTGLGGTTMAASIVALNIILCFVIGAYFAANATKMTGPINLEVMTKWGAAAKWIAVAFGGGFGIWAISKGIGACCNSDKHH